MRLSVAVLLSLGLSVTVVPLLARWAFRHHADKGETTTRTESLLFRIYGRTLDATLRHPILAVVVAVVLAAATVGLFYSVGTGFMPKADEGGFVVDVITPAGSALAETDRQLRAMENVLLKTPEVAAFSRRTGAELGLFATAQNKSDILVRLKPRAQRSRSAEEIISDLRPAIHEAAPLADVEFVQLLQDQLGDLEGAPTPIDVKIFGDDPENLPSSPSPSKKCSARSPASSTSSACRRAIPRSPGTSIRSPASAWASRCRTSRTSSPRRGSATSAPSCGCPIARCRSACACRTRSGSIRRGFQTRSFARARESSCRSRPSRIRRGRTDNRSCCAKTFAAWPASRGGWKAAILAARSPTSGPNCRNFRCRSATPMKSAGNTSRSGRRSASC